MKTAITLSLITICLTASVCFAQRGARGGDLPPAAGNREDALDPTPINPAVDPNVDLFINDYKNSEPRMIEACVKASLSSSSVCWRRRRLAAALPEATIWIKQLHVNSR